MRKVKLFLGPYQEIKTFLFLWAIPLSNIYYINYYCTHCEWVKGGDCPKGWSQHTSHDIAEKKDFKDIRRLSLVCLTLSLALHSCLWTSENHGIWEKFVIHWSPRLVESLKDFLALCMSEGFELTGGVASPACPHKEAEKQKDLFWMCYIFVVVSSAIYYTYSFRNSNLHMDFETMAWFSWEDSLCYFRRGCMMFTLHWQVLPKSVESFCNVFLCHSTTICCLDSVLSLISVMMYSLSCWWWKMDHWCFTWVVESNPWWFVLVVSIHVNVEKQGEDVKK